MKNLLNHYFSIPFILTLTTVVNSTNEYFELLQHYRLSTFHSPASTVLALCMYVCVYSQCFVGKSIFDRWKNISSNPFWIRNEQWTRRKILMLYYINVKWKGISTWMKIYYYGFKTTGKICSTCVDFSVRITYGTMQNDNVHILYIPFYIPNEK